MHKFDSVFKKLPDAPGIYLYYSEDGELVYVGKATSLKSRVQSYFRGLRTPRPIEEMIHEVARIEWKETESVLEAIILEALYIKKNQPKYNVLGKDDKSWNYIIITKELYPQVKTIRERELRLLSHEEGKVPPGFKYVFGPYPGLNTKATMKLLRRLFRFSSCRPLSLKPCLYRQMEECLGVCTGEISPRDYALKVIRPLVLFLQGEKKKLVREWENKMKLAAKEFRFEEAARLRDQSKSLYRIQDVALLNQEFFREHAGTNDEADHYRIEGYDISNLGDTDKVGSLVVADEHGPIKAAYRKFTIKTVVGQSDVDCLAEVLNRRLAHADWPLPTLFLIDGGRPQVNRAKEVLSSKNVDIPIVGLAKGKERKRNDIILGSVEPALVAWVSHHREALIRVRDEAHRFAITFNRSKRKIKR